MTEEKPKKKRFREKIGMVFRVNLKENGMYAYGQVATKTKNIFFDHFDKEGEWTPVEDIIQKPLTFYLIVDSYVLKEGIWDILGAWPVKPENQIFPKDFGYDSFKKTYFIWEGGNHVTCTLEETYGRECKAAWDHISVEQRLRDHFAGRPNYDCVSDRSEHISPLSIGIKKFYRQHGYDFHWMNDVLGDD